ncbi:DUF1153 domain-containing protein [Methylosinus sp. LW3]|uniref:CtrA inhibitor SciP n=1 Tax=Methylosinus sp. LW3 TaxID=107635 RepID=UPI000467C652|nr:DUF1153 domain-containing protein [Methylosinus sp. LW3]
MMTLDPTTFDPAGDDAANRIACACLPPPTTRWVVRRKAEVVAAVRSGVVSLDEVCRRYSLTPDEFNAWASFIDRHGVDSLRTTRLQYYRRRAARLAAGKR